MIDIKDLKIGQEVYYCESTFDVKNDKFEKILKDKPYIIYDIKINKYIKIFYEIVLEDKGEKFTITTKNLCSCLYSTKKEYIEGYIRACKLIINPIYKQYELAEKYLEETKECLQ